MLWEQLKIGKREQTVPLQHMPFQNAGKDPDFMELKSEHSCVRPGLSDLLMCVFISWGCHGSMANKYEFPHLVSALFTSFLHTNGRQSDQSHFIAVVTQSKIFSFILMEFGQLATLGSSFLKLPWLLSRGNHVLWLPWKQTLWCDLSRFHS